MGPPPLQTLGSTVEFGQGSCGLAASNRESVVVTNLETDPRCVDARHGTRSEICTPVVLNGKCLGVLQIASDKKGHFEPERADQIEAAACLARLVAMAIERAKLIQDRELLSRSAARSTQLLIASSVASGLAHELKNGLLAISTLAQRLEVVPAIKSNRANVVRLNDIKAESNKLAAMAIRLMDLSRVGEPAKTEIYLNEVIADRVVLLTDFAQTQDIELVTHLDPRLDRRTRGRGNPVMADAYQIQQVLTSLVMNAIDASHRRQSVQIETRLKDSGWVSFVVRDFGTGIAPKDKQKMFDMFFTTKVDGFGIGLPVVKILVEENHGGRIEVSSRSGKGSMFEVLLPRGTGRRSRGA